MVEHLADRLFESTSAGSDLERAQPFYDPLIFLTWKERERVKVVA